MGRHFYTSAELDHILAEINEHQHKDTLLRIDEILSVLGATTPAVNMESSPQARSTL